MAAPRLDQIAHAVQLAQAYKQSHRREFVPDWYPWQQRFFAESATHSQVMLLAANQVGKTFPSGYQDALDATGNYPEGWQGFKFDHPNTGWVLGVDNTQLKTVLQKQLVGDLLDGDTVTGGWIHPDEVVGVERSNAIVGLAKEIKVRHRSGGVSTIAFKAHSQARTGSETLPFAGSVVDWIHCDEQPPDDIVGQLVTRTINGNRGKGGRLRYTLTPEMGLTDMLSGFLNHPAPHQVMIGPIAWGDCPHITPERAAEMLASYPAHERDMRSKGIPLFGTGRIYTFDEEAILIDPFRLEDKPWLKCLRSIDIGINHPTGIAWLAFDPEQGITYLVRTHRKGDTPAPIHAATANGMWPNTPMVFPPDADGREKGSGDSVRKIYGECGITNSVIFSNPDGTTYVEPGIMALQNAIQAGKFLVFRGQCPEFVEETRSYHRDHRGQIVKERDDVLDAVRYGFQMIGRHGTEVAQRTNANHGGLYPQLGLRARG
jgi:phage terminase large subunit-like protein